MDDDDEERQERHHSSGSGGGIIGLIIVGLLCWWGYNHFLKPDEWIGMYETTVQTAVGVGPTFGSKEACVTWINEQRQNPGQRFNFECGSNCKAPQTETGPWRCDETAD